MAVAPGAGPGALTQLAPFRTYHLDAAHDEMFDGHGLPRPHYAALFERLLTLDPQELKQRQNAADLAFLHQGITFTVYGQKDGTERIFPYDLIPRILTAGEWEVIERGLTQRLTALNLFLKDIYHDGRILAEGVVPRRHRLQLQTFPAGNAGRLGAPGHVCLCGRHRPGAAARRRLRGARRQPARAKRRELHADQPPGDQARVPAALQQLRRAAGRSIRPGASGDVACARSAPPARSDHRVAHAGCLQLGVLRAHLPRAPDGHRAGRGTRPVRARQHRLHADHRRPSARGRDLPPGRR